MSLDQFRSSLLNVSDLFIMGGSLITECFFILQWAKSNGYFPLGISGNILKFCNNYDVPQLIRRFNGRAHGIRNQKACQPSVIVCKIRRHQPSQMSGMINRFAQFLVYRGLLVYGLRLKPYILRNSGAPVYTIGALSGAIPWEILQNKLENDESLKKTIRTCGWDSQMVRSLCQFFKGFQFLGARSIRLNLFASRLFPYRSSIGAFS